MASDRQELNTDQRVNLVSLASSAGWEELKKLMFEEVRQAYAEHLLTEPSDTAKVLSGFAEVRMAARFYTRVLKAVEHNVEEYAGEVQASRIRAQQLAMTPEEIMAFV